MAAKPKEPIEGEPEAPHEGDDLLASLVPQAAPKAASLEAEPVKPKRRHRAVKPETVAKASKATAKPPARRGRPPKAVQTAELSAQLTRTVKGLHEGLAVFFGPECKLEDKRAEEYGEALAAVAVEHDIAWLARYAPTLNLVGIVCICEAPVAMHIGGKVRDNLHARRFDVEVEPAPAIVGLPAGGGTGA
jgi:hypothetical protein